MRHLAIIALLAVVPLAVPATANAAPLDGVRGEHVARPGHHPNFHPHFHPGFGPGFGFLPVVVVVPVIVPVPIPITVPVPLPDFGTP